MRRIPPVFLMCALAACDGLTPPTGSTPGGSTPAEGALPTGSVPGSTTTTGAGTDGTTTPGTTPADPVDCSLIEAADADWEVCVSGPASCEVVFTDSAGCAAVCAAAGLACSEAYDNLEDQCDGDFGSPVDCASGHQSDYCVCAGPAQPIDECASYPLLRDTLLADRVGFGADATGGDYGNPTHVTTLADDGPGSLREALESPASTWIVFDVEGQIDLTGGRVHVQSNKTIDGRDRDITINGELYLADVHDVIFADLRLTNNLEGNCTQEGDVVLLTGDGGPSPSDFSTHDIWFHHVEFFDGGDGLLDMRGATDVTVSWSHFHTHAKGLLLGDDRDGGPAGGMQLTFHHNFFDRLTRRGPRLLHGRAHFYNNYQFEWYEYGVASIEGAQVYSENNVYQARPGTFCLNCPDTNPCGDHDYVVSKLATTLDWSADIQGDLVSVGDVPLEGAVIAERNPGAVFDPAAEYAYTAEPATVQLGDDLVALTGPREAYCP